MSADACSLVCVDPDRVHEFWPHVAPLIEAAMVKGRVSAFAPVADAVLDRRALLWLAWDGERITAAAVTELTADADGARFCTIVACGAMREDGRERPVGRERRRWLHLIAGLESYARAEGCAAMRIHGRRGWQRLLPDYRSDETALRRLGRALARPNRCTTCCEVLGLARRARSTQPTVKYTTLQKELT